MGQMNKSLPSGGNQKLVTVFKVVSALELRLRVETIVETNR